MNMRYFYFQKGTLKALLATLLFCLPTFAYSQAFITTWQTTDGQIAVPTFPTATYNYDVTWTNLITNVTGTLTAQTGDATIMGLTNNETYRIEITGTFPRIYFNSGGERLKIRTIEQWGNIAWTSMENAFWGCENLTYNATDAPNLAGVTRMFFMFKGCSSFNATDLTSWNVSTIQSMEHLFEGAIAFNGNVSNWNTGNVTNMQTMFGSFFSGSMAFNQNISSWNTSNVTDMSYMFYNATSFNQNISSWVTTSVTNMSNMFAGASAFNQPINTSGGAWNVGNVTDMSLMFASASAFNQNLNSWNVGNVTNMMSMFFNCPNFNGNVVSWNVSNVQDMSQMFLSTAFNQNISTWTPIAATTMQGMFRNSPFNQDISGWNVSNVQNMGQMFQNATAFNQPLNNWGNKVANVTSMRQMFYGAIAFNQDLNSWVVSSVQDMSGMFTDARSFNGDITGWNVSMVTNMSDMFSHFNENMTFNRNIGGWNVSAVTNMGSMFANYNGNTSAFNQSLANWNLNAINSTTFQSMDGMLNNCGMNLANYDATLIGWAANMNTPNNVILGATGRKYCNAQTARNTTLVTARSWTITGDAVLCGFHYRTAGNVTFASPTNWESSTDGTTWGVATSAPDATSNTLAITIQSGHTATITADITLDQFTIAGGGTLQVSTGITLTVADGAGTDLFVQGTIDIQGTGSLAGAGSFTLDAGGTFKTSHIDGFSAIGISGTKTFTDNAIYEFNGTALQTLNNPASLNPNYITINNSAGARLSSNFAMSGYLYTILGDLDLNGFDLDLGTTGRINEDLANNHLVKDNTAIGDANQGGGIKFSGYTVNTFMGDVGGTGLRLQRTTGSDYTVNVVRKHYQGAYNSQNKGIRRIYQVSGVATGTNTTMRIYYASDETVGIIAPFELYRWASGEGWKDGDASSAFDEGTHGANYAEAINVNAFSTWTVGSQAQPLPITLTGLKGRRVEGLRGVMTEEVRLEWSTASEIGNKGFEIQVSENAQTFKTIAFINGKGNSNTSNNYQLTTINQNDGYYRLKQVDFDGKFSYSPIVFVAGLAGKVVVYPNPNNGTFTINVGKDELDLPARLFNAQGIESPLTPEGGMYKVSNNLPAGVYFLHTVMAGKIKVTKIIIQK